MKIWKKKKFRNTLYGVENVISQIPSKFVKKLRLHGKLLMKIAATFLINISYYE